MMGFRRSSVVFDAVLLAGFCGFLFFFELGSFGLIGADEPRYAQVAREMLDRHDWITPTLNGAPWLEKPPLYYWQAIVAYKLLGVSDWAARLPSAADASLMTLAVYFFLRRFRPGFHLDGALMVASSAGVIGFSRAASTDMPLAAAFTVAMLAWYGWFESRKKPYLILFYVFLALGTLAKGPVAVLLAFLIIVSFAAANRDLVLARQCISFTGIAIFLAIAAPWYIAVQIRNPEFFRTFILQHNLARFGTNLYHHTEPFWYFAFIIVIGLLPWTTFVLAGLLESFGSMKRRRETDHNEYAVFIALWLLVPILFFSISSSKLPGYILPCFPAGLLLVAEYVQRHAGEKMRLSLIVVHSIVASALLVPAVMIQYIILEHKIPWGTTSEVALGLSIVIAAIMAMALKISGLRVLRTVTLIPVVLVVAIVIRVGGPSLDAALSARPLVREITKFESLGSPPSMPIAVFEAPRETEYGLQFYLNRSIPRYENHQIPDSEHIVIAPAGSQSVVAGAVAGRKVSYLGSLPRQRLDYFLISRSVSQ